MPVPKPIIVWALSLLMLALGLTALFFDHDAIMPLLLRAQLDVWAKLGASDVARPGWASAAEMGFLITASIAAIVLTLRTRIYWAGLFVLGALAIAFYASLLLARMQGAALDVLAPGAALLLVFGAGALARLNQVRVLKRDLRFAFADSLPSAAIDEIARDPSLLSMEGETRNVTYLACGVRDLAELSAAFRGSPKGFTKLLEQVLTPLMSQVLRYGGVIDRLTADGFTAYWNAPLDDPEHAAHACEAANGMMAALTRVNEDLTARLRQGGPEVPLVEIGVGIATGSAIAGGFGGHGRLRYSVNGDAVRLAALLQALSRNYGPAVIVAEETHKIAGFGFAFLEVDFVAQNREDTPVHLYAMLDNRISRASPKIRALATFHEHIFQCLKNQQWDKAAALVEQCSRLSGACHTLYELYRARIRYFESNPPGPGWDGAFRPVLK